MLAGYTYDSQLFTSEAFRKFQNEFINGNCGVLDGMSVTTTTTTATIANGWAIIKGGLLREQGGTTLSLTDNGYYIIALQIDLSQTNTETDFNQGSFVALRGANAYPTLTQQDLTNGGTLYQMGLAKFQKTDNGISGLTDIRPMLDWTSLYTQFQQALADLESESTVITTAGNKTITGTLAVEGGITGNVTGNLTGNASGSSSSCTGNAGTATKLATARTINGTNFDGSQNITTSKWGTSRNIALSGAVSGNANVDGSGNVTITTTQSNIAVVTTSITTPAAGSETTTVNTDVNYPSGFTQSNSVIISLMARNTGLTEQRWGTVGDTESSLELQEGVYGLRASMRPSVIKVFTSKLSTTEAANTRQIRIVLMKIS